MTFRVMQECKQQTERNKNTEDTKQNFGATSIGDQVEGTRRQLQKNFNIVRYPFEDGTCMVFCAEGEIIQRDIKSKFKM